ncbi:MAG: CBS domain-containing protein [Alphaproteobacteria bacterium]|nr:CBS domain-containing protein [Alphaproteobacteria bacterium]
MIWPSKVKVTKPDQGANMQVRTIMSSPVITIEPRTTIHAAVEKLLQARLSALPIVNEKGELLGIVSQSDLLHRIEIGTQKVRPAWLAFLLGPGPSATDYTKAHARYVEEIMTPDPYCIDADASLDDVVKVMEQHKIHRLPVLSQGRLVGIVSRADLLRALILADESQSHAQTPLADARIEEMILAEIARQDWATPDAIRVKVENGQATVSGTIFDERERTAIIVTAENVAGVTKVIDQMIWIDPSSGIYAGPPGTESGSL